mgnify:CR=1 FL=1
MEVLTIEHSAFQQLISKLDAMDEFIRKAKLEQQSSLDDDWVDGQAVCDCGQVSFVFPSEKAEIYRRAETGACRTRKSL